MGGEHLTMSKPMALIGKKKIDILHTPSEEIEIIDEEVMNIARRLQATARVNSCYSVAAVQVGIPINMIAWKNGDVCINTSVYGEGDMEDDFEGCLSIPGKQFLVPRFVAVSVQTVFLTSSGPKVHEDKVEGMNARIWQHEYDHIEGKLLSDSYSPTRR